MRSPLGEVRPYVPGETPVARLLAVPADLRVRQRRRHHLGRLAAELAVHLEDVLGRGPGLGHASVIPWFFGIPPPPVVAGAPLPANKTLFIGLVAVYGGMVL